MLFFIIVALASSTFETKEERSMFLFMRATERLSLVDGDDENANSDDNADCKIVSNNESPTPPANKKKERKKEREREREGGLRKLLLS